MTFYIAKNKRPLSPIRDKGRKTSAVPLLLPRRGAAALPHHPWARDDNGPPPSAPNPKSRFSRMLRGDLRRRPPCPPCTIRRLSWHRRDGLLSPSSQIRIFSLYYTHFCGVCQREKFTYSWPPAPWRPCPHTPRRTGSAEQRSRYPWCRPPCACRDSACGRST